MKKNKYNLYLKENLQKILKLLGRRIPVYLLLIAFTIIGVFLFQYENHPDNRSDDKMVKPIELIKSAFPELSSYPDDNKSDYNYITKMKRLGDSTFYAFARKGYSETADINIMGGKCFSVENTGKIKQTGTVLPNTSSVDPLTCYPENYKEVGEYTVIVKDDDFEVREYMIPVDERDFYIPEGRKRFIDEEVQPEYQDSLEITDVVDSKGNSLGPKYTFTAGSDKLEFSLTGDSYHESGFLKDNALIKKNGKVLFKKKVEFGAVSIGSVMNPKLVEGELVMGYIDDYYADQYNHMHSKVSILKTEGDELVDFVDDLGYMKAFRPSIINGKLAFFKEIQKDKYILQWNDKVYLDDVYERIHDARCCEPSVWQVLANDKNKIDFFARRNGIDYHVQVGFF